MKKRDVEYQLDKTLHGHRTEPNPEIDALSSVADDLELALNQEAPDAARERLLFTMAVGAQKRRITPGRFMVPITAAMVILIFLAVAGRESSPGDDLYSVRKALGKVGLVDTALRVVDRSIETATAQVGRAGLALASGEEERARRHANSAFISLGEGRAFLAELDEAQREIQLRKIEALEKRAIAIIVRSRERDRSGSDGEDNSGPSVDNSGSGSDNSGSGSDNSGSGSGDSDNSGSGSDNSGSGSDNSGSGSDDSGSGSDSSGSGSGSDD